MEKERNTKTTLFYSFGILKKSPNFHANSRKMSSHAGKTAISEMSTNKKNKEIQRNFWKMSSHAGKTAFFIKNTSKFIPKILPKTVQNTSKMEPKTVPKRSRTPSQKYVAPTSPKWPKRAPKMTSKWSLKSEKNVLGALFFNSKKAQFSEAVFLSFGAFREALDPENQAKTL